LTLLTDKSALTQNDETLLHGRGEVVGEIVQNCRSERLTVIVSEPGLGVTSLLQAGVAPALRREGFIVASFSDWQGHLFAANLKEAIAVAVRESADPVFLADSEPLAEMLARIRAHTGRQVAILLDQFEDYVRCHANTVISDFFDAELGHAVAERKGVFVIGLQEHAMLAFGRLAAHIPNLLGFPFWLAPLSAEAARAVVTAEAHGMQMEVEPAAIDKLVNAPMVIRDSDKAHPFFLRLATGLLLEAETRLKSRVLRASTIGLNGDVDQLILGSFDTPIAELGKVKMDLLSRWCGALISPDGQRLAVTEKKLTEYAGSVRRLVPVLLPQLAELGILRAVETQGAIRYEVARECFAPILHDWWERREAVILARRRAIFRITSVSVALSSIFVVYLMWLFFRPK
jgi:hypothetical protein